MGLKSISEQFRTTILNLNLQSPPDVVTGLVNLTNSVTVSAYLNSIGQDALIHNYNVQNPGDINTDGIPARELNLNKTLNTPSDITAGVNELSASAAYAASFLDGRGNVTNINDYSNVNPGDVLTEAVDPRNLDINKNLNTPVDITAGVQDLTPNQVFASQYLSGRGSFTVINDFNVVNPGDVLTDAIPTLEGSYAVAGYSASGIGGNKTSGTNGGVDYWVLKLTGAGAVYWDKNYGSTLNDSCSSIFQTCDRGYLVGGWSNSPIAFDKYLSSRGVYDYWVVKLGVPTDPNFDNQTICLSEPMTFRDLTNVWPDTWEWDFGDSYTSPETNKSNDQHPIHTYSQAGIYDVTLTVREGCQNDTTVTRKVEVWDNKVLNKIDLGLDTSVCVDHEILLQNLESIPFGSTFLWSTGDTAPSIIVDTIGFYTLTVTNEHCSAQDVVEVDYCPEIWIPNAFTPNGDDKNDMWYIYGVGLRDVEFMIFDRWGMLLFTGNSQDVGWDGYFKGDLCQIDVYVYKVRYKGITAREKIRYGRISLIR